MSIIVIGAGEIGYHVAKRLSLEKKDVIVIDKDPEKVDRVRETLDVEGIVSSGSSPGALENAGIKNADMLIAVTDSDEVNMMSCLVANAQNKAATKVARVRNLEYIYDPEILKKGNLTIDLIINPGYEAVFSLISLLQVPGATDVVDFDEGAVKLIGCTVQNPLFHKGIPLSELHEKSGITDLVVVSICRNGRVTIPRGTDKIFYRDAIYAVTGQDRIGDMMRFFGQESREIKKAMIVGGGSIGLLLAREFEKMKISTRLIEQDESRCTQLAEQLDKTIVLHHPDDVEEIISEEHLEGTDIFIAVTDDEEDNIIWSLLAKQKGVGKTAALINNMTYTQVISRIGVNLVVNPNLSAINRILHFIRRGKVLSVASFYETDTEAIEAVALETSDIVNTPLKDVRLPKHAIIGAIVRAGKLIIPRGGTIILPDDHVIIFARSSEIPSVEKLLTVKVDYW